MPFLDYNESNIPATGGQHISSWINDTSATGGSAYDATDEGVSNTNTTAAGFTSWCATMSANISAGNYFELGSAYENPESYTMYVAFGFPAYTNMYEFFGSTDGSGRGFSNGRSNVFSIIHNLLTGLPATSRTDNTDNSTVDYKFPDPGLETNAKENQSMYVFVIRRDKDYNLYLYNFRGDVAAIIPAKTGGTAGVSGRTDGTLQIKTFGGYDPDYLFKGFLARFGVISSDVGHSTAKSIAKDLYKRYAANYAFFN